MCKKSIKNSQPFVKKMKNVRTPQGGGLTHTVRIANCYIRTTHLLDVVFRRICNCWTYIKPCPLGLMKMSVSVYLSPTLTLNLHSAEGAAVTHAAKMLAAAGICRLARSGPYTSFNIARLYRCNKAEALSAYDLMPRCWRNVSANSSYF